MHASIEQLLNLRDAAIDGQFVDAGLKQHVEHCALCRERLDELVAVREDLNRLPVQGPQRDHWPDILAAAGYSNSSASRQGMTHRMTPRRTWYAGIGLAASVVLAALIMFNLVPDSTTNVDDDAAVASVDTKQADDDSEDDTVASDADKEPRKWTTEEIDALVARSQSLEQTLRTMPDRPSVKRASTSDTIMGLEQGIALVDYQINYGGRALSAEQQQRLWRHRVDLMNSLVSVRYVEARPSRVASRR